MSINVPQELVNQLKTEYVSIGKQIKTVFNLHANEDNYYVEYEYHGYHTHDKKCSDPNGEYTQFILTDKLTGKVNNVSNLTELIQGGIYTQESLTLIWAELIKLTSIEKSINDFLENVKQQTEVYYGRELFVQNHNISMLFSTHVFNMLYA